MLAGTIILVMMVLSLPAAIGVTVLLGVAIIGLVVLLLGVADDVRVVRTPRRP
jgi:hypothetical protein